jgi:hypothetical protein
MNGPEMSDRCIVPRKSSNNAERSAAERMGEGACQGETGSATHAPGTGPGQLVPRAGPVLLRHCMGRPNPERRNHPRQEPGAGKPHAGIRAGGVQSMCVPTATMISATRPYARPSQHNPQIGMGATRREKAYRQQAHLAELQGVCCRAASYRGRFALQAARSANGRGFAGAIPCSNPAEQRNGIIQNGVALVAQWSGSGGCQRRR